MAIRSPIVGSVMTVRLEVVDFVTARGHRFAISARSGAGPTVVFETGLGAEAEEWQPVVEALPPSTSTLLYDRLNRGASDTVDGARTSGDMAEDLRAVLSAAEVPAPYIVVGHSFGAHVAMSFAASAARDVAGVLLVDPTHARQFDTFGPVMPPGPLREFWTDGWRRTDSTPEHIDFAASFAATDVLQLGAIPLRVLVAGATMAPPAPPEAQQAWEQLASEWLLKSDDAALERVDGSGHFIQRDRPDAVATALRDLLASASDA